MTKTLPLKPQQSAWLMRAMAAGVLVVAGAAATPPAHAQEGGPGPAHAMAGPGADMMMFSGQPRQFSRMVDHLLDGLNTTDAQRAQIRQIAMVAAADTKPQRDAIRIAREKGLQILTAPTVDAVAAEAVRQQTSVQLDTVSKRYLKAMLDVSNVLTPEQRAKVGERMKQREAKMQEREHRGPGERDTPRAKP